MKQISAGELRQNASVWLRKVQEGERFEVTDRDSLWRPDRVSKKHREGAPRTRGNRSTVGH